MTLSLTTPHSALYTRPSFSKAGCVVVLTLAVTFTGCLRPYSKPVIDPSGGTFPGITSEWARSPSKDVRVIFVHGMCTHSEESWVDAQWDVAIPKYFSSSPPARSTLPAVGEVQIFDREYQIGANRISGRFVVWSALTATDKTKIQFDNPPTYVEAPGQFTWKRASLNATLKSNILNDCLSDAVIYAGYRSSEIQTALENAICAALDGSTSSNSCEFPEINAHADRRIVIVAESLGSRMVFDAITALQGKAKRKSAQSLAAFDAHVAPISQIFMLANQLPILALARPPESDSEAPTGLSSSTESVVSALTVLSNARARHRSVSGEQGLDDRIHLIAFTDPNDLLSYRIPADATAILGAGASVVNVITSNADTYFGYVENPLPAHTAYDQNKSVLNFLFNGTRPVASNLAATVVDH